MSETVKKERFTSYLPSELIERLRELSDKTGIPQAKLLEKAVSEMFENLDKDPLTFFFKKDEA